ncbi:tetratricopeptide repeat-containing sensor histidine kinase [Pseudobacter ginsenosidimutans]|uniref:Tetratricopeptide repeat protein n=1 Tax=Pseudobacter ginsenosidimutans TaxID=661488 RepID=A0A4Q7N3I5_9BACT|nr:sensor histidine kinase [Pseudobacter ginsenosidimutans]QEC43763.1 tetratricopeptide repeat protein [Pseudobacter ginsenosidimutans]RZS75178.1 tetratricopeptide repeat protein [Pseudobacter ginsenosidimutans]
MIAYTQLLRSGRLLFLAFLIQSACLAQTIDSVHQKYRQQLAAATNDSNSLRILLEYGADLTWFAPDSALPVIKKAAALSLQLKDTAVYARTWVQQGNVYADKGDYVSAQTFYEKGIEVYKSINHHRGIGGAYLNIGNLYNFQDKLEESISYYLKAVDMLEKAGTMEKVATTYNNIATTFSKLGQYEKSQQYTNKALPIALLKQDTLTLIQCYISLGTSEHHMKNNQASINWTKKAMLLSDKKMYAQGSYMTRANLSEIYTERKMYDSALYYLYAAKPLAEQANDPYYLSSIYLNYANTYYQLKQFSEAESFALKSIQTAHSVSNKESLMNGYNILTRIYAAMGKPEKSSTAFDQYILYHDSLRNYNMAEKVNQLETKFRTLQKDKDISEKMLAIEKQKAVLKKKDTTILFIVTALVAIALIALLTVFALRQKQKMQQQQLQSMAKEKELEAARAMIEGEESERARIARDLHDGAGSMLSAAKLQLEYISRKSALSGGAAELKEITGLITDAATEVRTTAHNLMPAILYREGIHEAVSALCNKFNHPPLEVEYHVIGEPVRFHPHFELMVYRTVQELMNNIVKHAGATHAMVQLSFGPEHFSVVVEDNGTGFDLSAANKNEGLGLTALQSKLKAFRGEMDLQSSESGTSVNLEFDTTG